MSGVSIPRCSMDLNPNVRGNGSFTAPYTSILAFDLVREHALRMKPWKKKFIHPMMTICGTIITICVFMPAIIPSIAAGSIGFGGAACASPFGGPSLR